MAHEKPTDEEVKDFPHSPQCPDYVDSAGDDRVVNNAMRHQYKVLTEAEKLKMQEIKDRGLEFWEFIDSLGKSRETSLAKTHIEDAVMRAVRHITE